MNVGSIHKRKGTRGDQGGHGDMGRTREAQRPRGSVDQDGKCKGAKVGCTDTGGGWQPRVAGGGKGRAARAPADDRPAYTMYITPHLLQRQVRT